MKDNFYCGKGRATPGSMAQNGAKVISVATGTEKDAFKMLCAAVTAATDAQPSGAKVGGNISAKVDRVVELTRQVVARRTAPIHSMPSVPSLSEMARSPGPSAGQLAAQWQTAYAARAAKACAESEAAYAARNPHKKERT